MGTRHLQTAINSQGECKLANYGQWDGYPDGQGVEILKYLWRANLKKYDDNLSMLREITKSEMESINNGVPECFLGANRDWKKEYPYLSRDCGSDIHQMIEDGLVKFVLNCEAYTDEEKSSSWCEGFYTIDLQKREFVSEFNGITKAYSLDNLPTEEQYLKDMREDNE